MKVVKSLGAFMLVNNITTLINKFSPQTEKDCLAKFSSLITYNDVSNYCVPVFDSYLCWPPTKPNTLVQQFCPIARLSDPSHYASRRCRSDGLWEGRETNNASIKGWTNFTACFPKPLQKLLNGANQKTYDAAKHSRYIELTGYSVSTVSIVFSLFIFNRFRSLQDVRIKIHKHMFVSMLLQNVVHLMIYFDQIIIRKSTENNKNENELKGIDNTPVLCEVLYFIGENSINTVFSWMFIEGKHLNNLISEDALQPFNFKLYCLAGWAVPFIVTSIWAIVTWISYSKEKIRLCWFGYNLTPSYWILQGPRLAVILCNTVILVRVLRMVIKKLKDTRTREIVKIRKSVKAALFLLPLLGLSSMLSTIDVPISTNTTLFMVWSYTSHFLKSFQGVFLCLIYCWGNEEVRTVLSRKFRNTNIVDRFRWIMPRRPVTETINLPTSRISSIAPPNTEETTVSHVLRSTRLDDNSTSPTPGTSFSTTGFTEIIETEV